MTTPTTSPDAARAAGTPFERIGGHGTLRAAVDEFYRRVLDDASLAPFFAGVDVARVKRHQVLLLAQVLDGPTRYDASALGAAHAHLGITDGTFDRVVAHLVATLTDLGVPADLIAHIGDRLAPTRAQIVGRAGGRRGTGAAPHRGDDPPS